MSDVIVVAVVAGIVAVATLVVLGYLMDELLVRGPGGHEPREDDIRVPFTR